MLSEEKLEQICRKNGEKTLFQEDFDSYYQTYYGQGEVAIYFKNKFVDRRIDVKLELVMQNMKIRG